MSESTPESKSTPSGSTSVTDVDLHPVTETQLPQTTVDSLVPAIRTSSHDIFSRRAKLFIVFTVSVAGFFSPFGSNIYIPALTQVSEDLNITQEAATLTVTIYLAFQGLAPSFWAPLADIYGRRPIYIATFLVFIAACIGLGKANSLTALLVLRALQASGASSTISIGAGTVGDITIPAERGSFMGWYAFGQYMGPALGPVLGGILAQRLGYHSIFWFLAIFAGVFTLVLIALLPETLPIIVANGPTPRSYMSLWQLMTTRRKNENGSGSVQDAEKAAQPLPPRLRPKLSEVSFLGPYKYLAEWDIALLCFMYSINYGAYYAMTASQSDLFTEIYGLDSLKIGLTFLPSGVGCAIGTIFGGKVIDLHYRQFARRYEKARASAVDGEVKDKDVAAPPPSKAVLAPDFPIIEARLQALPYYIGFYAAAFVAYGWLVKYRINLAAPLIVQFIVGFLSTCMFGNINTLLVDLFPSKPASATATNNLTRCLMGAVTTAVVTYILNGLGPGWTFVLFGGLIAGISYPAIFIVGKWGKLQRAKRLAVQIAAQKLN